MNTHVATLIIDGFNFICAVIICLFMVKDKIKIPFAVALTIPLIATVIYTFMTYGISEAIANITMIGYFPIMFFYYRYIVDIPGNRLLFLMMTVFNIFCFAVGSYYAFNFDSAEWKIVAIDLFISLVTAVVMYPIIKKYIWKYIETAKGNEWRLLWVIPLSFSIIQILFVFAFRNLPGWLYILILFFTLFSAFVTYYLILSMLDRTIKNTEAVERARAAESYLLLQKAQYSRINKNIQESQMANHDMRHQLTVLKSYYSKGDIEKVNEYIDKFMQSVPSFEEKIWCDNYTLNAAVGYYLSIAEQENVELDIKLNMPADSNKISDLDLCILIGNLLENALDACRYVEKNKFIRARTGTRGGYLTVMIENSFDGLWNEENGVLISRKSEDESVREGIGVTSVKAICEKYNGLFKYEINDNLWTTSVLLKMNETGHRFARKVK